MKPTPNFKSGTVWTGDNLSVMRGMNSDSIDLVYLDPPFNSNEDYSAPTGSEAAGAMFKDIWTLDDIDLYEHGELADRNPAAYSVIDAARMARGGGMMSYLIFMAVRLLEMERILKDTGAIYLHCDPTASHYLKLLLDAVFGGRAFRNEIVWKRTSAANRAERWGPVHDVLLYYSRAQKPVWNRVFMEYDPAYIAKTYRHVDERGPHRRSDLTGTGQRSGDSGRPWRGIDPNSRHWALPSDSALPDWFERPDDWKTMSSQQRLDALDSQGLIYWPPRGTKPSFKGYLSTAQGVPAQDVIIDIGPLRASDAERTGYPTQKPLALLERVIRSSSNKGDLVFDPFCGCATTLVAADRLERRWVGCDLSPLAVKLVRERIAADQGLFRDVIALEEPPRRTDLGKLPNYRTHAHFLYGKQEGVCAGCDTHFPFRVMEVDHILPKSQGGSDHADNLQLLCSHCNRSKGGRTMATWVAEKAAKYG